MPAKVKSRRLALRSRRSVDQKKTNKGGRRDLNPRPPESQSAERELPPDPTPRLVIWVSILPVVPILPIAVIVPRLCLKP